MKLNPSLCGAAPFRELSHLQARPIILAIHGGSHTHIDIFRTLHMGLILGCRNIIAPLVPRCLYHSIGSNVLQSSRIRIFHKPIFNDIEQLIEFLVLILYIVNEKKRNQKRA